MLHFNQLPIQGPPWPHVEDDPDFQRNCKRYGDSVARMFAREYIGTSTFCLEAVRAGLLGLPNPYNSDRIKMPNCRCYWDITSSPSKFYRCWKHKIFNWVKGLTPRNKRAMIGGG